MLIRHPNYYGEKAEYIHLVGFGDDALLMEHLLIPMPDGLSALVGLVALIGSYHHIHNTAQGLIVQ